MRPYPLTFAPNSTTRMKFSERNFLESIWEMLKETDLMTVISVLRTSFPNIIWGIAEGPESIKRSDYIWVTPVGSLLAQRLPMSEFDDTKRPINLLAHRFNDIQCLDARKTLRDLGFQEYVPQLT